MVFEIWLIKKAKKGVKTQYLEVLYRTDVLFDAWVRLGQVTQKTLGQMVDFALWDTSSGFNVGFGNPRYKRVSLMFPNGKWRAMKMPEYEKMLKTGGKMKGLAYNKLGVG